MEEAKSQLELFLPAVLILFAIISKGRDHLDQGYVVTQVAGTKQASCFTSSKDK